VIAATVCQRSRWRKPVSEATSTNA
jgi:hypothetical protein